MAFYRLVRKDGTAPYLGGMSGIYAGTASIAQTVCDDGPDAPPLDDDGFAPDGWIWHPGHIDCCGQTGASAPLFEVIGSLVYSTDIDALTASDALYDFF